MDNLTRNSEKNVTLEDLLKLKKLERPDEVFWAKFDEHLHDKTLKRLVYRGSIFSQVSNVLLIIFKPAVSLGVLALLTVSIISYNYKPKLYSQSQLTVVSNGPSKQATESLINLTSVKKNYVKTSIAMDSSDDHHSNNLVSGSSNGVRYLAGNIHSSNFGKGITSNTIY